MQGSLQCCVTGSAFQQMLQQADSSVVLTVMGSVAVFARMRGQQKGQVMDLLGQRGLYHMHAGEQHHLPVSTCLAWHLYWMLDQSINQLINSPLGLRLHRS